jgi:hypothetical protein
MSPAGNTDARAPASGASAEEIERDIERTRAQLGETAGALAHRLDAKAQVKEKVQHARARGAESAGHAKHVAGRKAYRAQQAGRNFYRERPTVVLGLAAGLATVAVGAVLWRRNR